MIFKLISIWASLARIFFYRKIIINKPEYLNHQGPVLLACNHPNSFIDGVILATLFKNTVHILTRGDAFKKPWAKKILCDYMAAIPVYRLSEGKENLVLNDATFEASKKALASGEIVLIFSEGISINEWKLRPLKKGTARVAFLGWNDPNIGDELMVLPVGINTSSFSKIGKRHLINFGNPIFSSDFESKEMSGKNILKFNTLLKKELENNVITKPDNLTDEEFENKLHNGDFPPFKNKSSIIKALMLVVTFPLGLIGYIINAPIYYPLKSLAKSKTKNTVFYDSVLFGILMIIYPFYTGILSILTGLIAGFEIGILSLFLIPATAYCTIRLKYNS